jgi:hypothetical protein
MTLRSHVELRFNVPSSTFLRLRNEAAQRGISVQAVAREAIEKAFPPPKVAKASPVAPTGVGLRWKEVFLPEGTKLSFNYAGAQYIAEVVGNQLIHDGRPTTPSRFLNEIAGAPDKPRNAWRDLWVRRPGDAGWRQALLIRAEVSALDHFAAVASAPAEVSAGHDTSGDGTRHEVNLPDLSAPVPRHSFGHYPISNRMRPRYLDACRAVLRIIEARLARDGDLDYVSEAKGMVNRVVRRDRPDWHTVYELFGRPDLVACRSCARWLETLRTLIKEEHVLDDHVAAPEAIIANEIFGKALSWLEGQQTGGSTTLAEWMWV